MTKKVLYFDIEAFGVEHRWNMTPREYFRLGQYAWGRDGVVVLTEDYDEMISVIREADLVIGHNIHSFDLSVLFGVDSTEPLEMALDGKIMDTMVWANLMYPAPYSYTDQYGHTWFDAAKPEKALRWLSLANLSYQKGLDGKFGDLKALAKKYALDPSDPEDIETTLDAYGVSYTDDLPSWAWDSFGRIPLDDPEFLAYAEQDVHAVRDLAIRMLDDAQNVIEPYVWREQINAAIDAQNSRNGFCVDVQLAQKRVDELKVRRDEIMVEMVEKYNLPTTGKSPWASNAGKDAIFSALAEYGITPENTPDWPRTKPGKTHPKGTPSLGGQELISITVGTPAEELGQALAELKGQRSLAQLAIDSVQEDGRTHPEISSLQRSGRKSTTKPGLTVWSARGEKAVEKAYFVASPGRKLFEADYSSADARIVAAYSGDTAFAQRFAPDAIDSHEISARLMYGDEEVERQMPDGWRTNDDIRKNNPLRRDAKALGHAYAYRAGAKTLAKTSGQTEDVAQKFVDSMNAAYPMVTKWQERVTREGESGFVTNDWGRRMVIDTYWDAKSKKERSRAYTQAPAMYGQSGTRELMVDALIRMARRDIRLVTWVVAQVHDALVFDIPEEHLDWATDAVKECMETTFQPKVGGQPVLFEVSVGNPADDWYLASH